MSNQSPSKLEFFVNLFNNLFHKRNLIIFIGRNGLTIAALKKYKVLDSIFVGYKTEKYYQKYRQFLAKYKNYHVLFLLDNKECELKHEMLPVLGSLVKSNPMHKFVTERYDPEDIVAYKVYEISNQNGEIWKVCVASSIFTPEINEILGYIIKKSLKYSGMYFLPLEFGTIIDRILQTTDNLKCSDHLQLFITITKSSGIKIVAKHKEDIMSEETFEYPYDKSDEYLHGTIEQAISDKLLFYKEYIKKLNLNVCIIFLIDNDLKNLISKLDFPDCKLITVSADDINISTKQIENRFQDLALLEIFNSFNSYLALNKPLRSITKLTLTNSIVFKPIIALIIAIVINLGTLKYQAISIQAQTNELNSKYYSLSEEYRDIKKRHPQVSNINDLVDLYQLERIANRKAATPYEHIKSLITIQHQNLKINKLTWTIKDPVLVNLPDSELIMSLNITYDGKADSAVDGIEVINGYANHLKTVFQDYKVVYTKNANNITEVAKRVIIPANFLITGKLGER
ncbi:MAG: hypothetical protein Tsb006_6390 [Rickettsiaceae bacterium]